MIWYESFYDQELRNLNFDKPLYYGVIILVQSKGEHVTTEYSPVATSIIVKVRGPKFKFEMSEMR